ncbi:MAG: hypothetical protein KIPDCIKN_03337 [Haliscomenobacter sp.]|nr:hypothetical protein [Haliscomenobacter sp.]
MKEQQENGLEDVEDVSPVLRKSYFVLRKSYLVNRERMWRMERMYSPRAPQPSTVNRQPSPVSRLPSNFPILAFKNKSEDGSNIRYRRDL